MIRRSPPLAAMLPQRDRRHDFSTFEQIIGGSVVDMVWSNSPAALASVPARIVILDEVDKFNEGGKKEADAVNLSEQRTKSFANPKRCKTSSPTLVTGLIWQEFLKTDQRRRYLPCPFCKKFLVLCWSRTFTIFKPTGDEAEVMWDKTAKKPDGTWDLDRVEKSAHYRCPHCGGRILDAHKTAMDRGGFWKPTADAARGYRGWHLPSLYSASAEANVGRLAVKFIQAQQSLLGLQGFINGDLAEPYQSQDTRRKRVEIVTKQIEVKAEWHRQLSVDCQERAPHFWHVVRAFDGGHSVGLQAGPLDNWADVRAVQVAENIKDEHVIIDSGYGARSDADVYKTCAQFSRLEPLDNGTELALGWMPSKGLPGRKLWPDSESKTDVPYYLRPVDPFFGTSQAGQIELSLFMFSTDFFKDILEQLRRGRGQWRWTVVEALKESEEYWLHLDAEVNAPVKTRTSSKTVLSWQLRDKRWPNHLLDCEVLQLALANFLNIFKIEVTK